MYLKESSIMSISFIQCIYSGMCTHIHQSGLELLPFFFLQRKCTFKFFINEYISTAVCAQFPFPKIYWLNTKLKYQVGRLDCEVPMLSTVSPSLHVSHTAIGSPFRQTGSSTSHFTVPCYAGFSWLILKVSGDEQINKLPVPRVYS